MLQVDLQHLVRLTDDTGLVQHAIYSVPDPNHGYCIDDNARGLIACVRYRRLVGEDAQVNELLRRYLMFVTHAYNAEAGVFRNFMGYDRRWLEAHGSEDSQGRTAWALGQAMRDAELVDVRDLAGDLFRQALPGFARLGHARAWAFALLGLNAYLDAEPDDRAVLELRRHFAHRLHEAYRAHATDDWPWWEEPVTYDNAKLCQALYETGRALGEPAMCRDAARTLRWLIDQQTADGSDGSSHLSIIGNDGWLRPGSPRPRFDQQPLEAWALVEACTCLTRSAEDAASARAWMDQARWCFAWFTGRNDLGLPLLDPQTGGCGDGLHATGVNRNQGAESILSYLLAQLALCDSASPHQC